ncbi:glycodelin isoform X6 [Homo sapiens]|uniref:glycodelin isoform X6 n=1 Tax=Homo sapiens TaxID=9606 RepID=UPI0007DC5AC3|nr:glycodelin isoform X6 [Homo sapiens]|eukprot:XP_016870271.1 glycodelin isoform X6 [Homo sapiens]
MLCLLLTLGVALVCGVPAMDIPQTKQDLELPKDTTTPIQSMMCQYLGKASGAPQLSWKPQGPRTDPASSTARVLVEDDEIMQGFIRAFRPLPRHLWYLLDLKQMEEPCRF